MVWAIRKRIDQMKTKKSEKKKIRIFKHSSVIAACGARNTCTHILVCDSMSIVSLPRPLYIVIYLEFHHFSIHTLLLDWKGWIFSDFSLPAQRCHDAYACVDDANRGMYDQIECAVRGLRRRGGGGRETKDVENVRDRQRLMWRRHEQQCDGSNKIDDRPTKEITEIRDMQRLLLLLLPPPPPPPLPKRR